MKEKIIHFLLILVCIYWGLRSGEQVIIKPDDFIPTFWLDNIIYWGSLIGVTLFPVFLIWIYSLKKELKNARNKRTYRA